MAGAAVRATKRSTVKAALEAYLADLRLRGRADAAKGAEWRFKKYVRRSAGTDHWPSPSQPGTCWVVYRDAALVLSGVALPSTVRGDVLIRGSREDSLPPHV
jgi:hypothetical protein